MENLEKTSFVPLGELCDIFDHLRKPVTKKDRIKGKYPYYGASGVQDYVSDFIFDGRYMLVGEDGAKWASKDKSAFIVEGKCWVNNHAHVLKTKPGFLEDYLVHYLNYTDLNKYTTGAVIPKLTQSALRSIPIPIISTEEQKKFLSQVSVLEWIISKKTDQLRELDKLAESTFYAMFGDPVLNTKSWDQSTLSSVCDVRDGTHDSPKYADSGYPLITTKNLKDGDIDFERANLISKLDYDTINKRSKVDKGDILMPMIGTIGFPVIVKTQREFCVKNVALIKFHSTSGITNIYLKHLLDSNFKRELHRNNQGGNQKFIALGALRKLIIPVPSMDVQHLFGKKIQALEKQKEIIKKSIEDVQQLFDYTMDKYFA